MPKSTELIAEETRELRLRLKALIDSGMSKSKALLKVFPNDSNRSRRLKFWEKEGLFPISEAELEVIGRTWDTIEHPKPVVPFTIKTVVPDTTVIKETDKRGSVWIPETPTIEPLEGKEPETVVPDTTVIKESVRGLDPENLLRLIDKRAGEVVENRLKGLVAELHVAEKPSGGGGRVDKAST